MGIFWFGAWGASKQAPPATPAPGLTPTENQSLRLTNKQLVAQLRQKDAQQAELAFQQSLADLQAEADKVKTEQGWPKETQFDIGTLKFTSVLPEKPNHHVEGTRPPEATPKKP